jgi:fucose permease
MNTWKSIGWLITRKSLYYAVIVILVFLLGSGIASLLTAANTLTVIVGVLGLVLLGSGFVTLVIREIFYWSQHNKEKQT